MEAKTLAEGLDLWLAVANRGFNPVSIATLTDQLGHSRSKVRRLLRTLEGRGLVERAEGGWVISRRLVALVASLSADLAGRIAELSQIKQFTDTAKMAALAGKSDARHQFFRGPISN